VATIDRRSFLKHAAWGVAGLGLAGSPALLAACSSSKNASSPGSTASTGSSAQGKAITSITLPFLADMQVPDPDVFYEAEGLQVTMSCYENLLRYTPNASGVPLAYQPASKRIAPGLAESWEISSDGLTYTFHLRPNVKFHDGTLADSTAWKLSFIRRGAVNQGPAYQVQPVASMETPDPVTFVVHLKTPVDPFLDYLACPYGPKVTSPAVVAAHNIGGDMAQKWLSTHDAGTGPYMITEFVPSNHYTLEAFPGYWGPQPEVQKVNIPIIPDIQTQELQFKAGQVDVITKGLPMNDVVTLAKDPNYHVSNFATSLTTAILFNATPGRIFANPAVRLAVKQAINKPFIVKSVWKGYATASTQFFPGGCFPDGLVADNPAYDPSILTKLAGTLPSKKVDIAYGEEGGAINQLASELVQTELSAAGLNVTVRGIPTSQEFALYNTPDSQRPDILLDLYGGDTIHVDTLLRVVFRTGAQPLNWFDNSLPAADKLMDQASASPDPQTAINDYQQSAQIIRDANLLANLANNADIVVVRKGITNVLHDPMTLQTIRIADLKAG
jgi:peptide/nickel transport system substrate-binding protein